MRYSYIKKMNNISTN